MSDDPEILYSVTQDVAHIRLNAPARLNALSTGMADTLVEMFARAQREARAILLTGAGRSFCAGVDLSDAAALPGPGVDGGAILERHFNPMVQAIRDLQIPIVSAVQGAAAGLGMALSLSADIIVAARSSYFFAPFARIGLSPDGGVPALLTRAIGRVRAAEVMLLAEKVPAERALEWGLVTRVVEDDELDREALLLAEQLATGPTVALGAIRRLCWESADQTLRAELQMEREWQRDIPGTADCQEGNAAFREKRKPRFSGR